MLFWFLCISFIIIYRLLLSLWINSNIDLKSMTAFHSNCISDCILILSLISFSEASRCGFPSKNDFISWRLISRGSCPTSNMLCWSRNWFNMMLMWCWCQIRNSNCWRTLLVNLLLLQYYLFSFRLESLIFPKHKSILITNIYFYSI
jgi:hypothetical protein